MATTLKESITNTIYYAVSEAAKGNLPDNTKRYCSELAGEIISKVRKRLEEKAVETTADSLTKFYNDIYYILMSTASEFRFRKKEDLTREEAEKHAPALLTKLGDIIEEKQE